jgi:DNA-binding response OmpR family regulator
VDSRAGKCGTGREHSIKRRLGSEGEDRILVIDPDRAFRKFAEAALLYLGFVPELAVDARHGLESLKGNVFATVLMELQLPDRSGVSLVEEISVTANAPVVIATAATSAEAVRAAILAGAVAVLCKPVRLRELAQCLNTVARVAHRRESAPTTNDSSTIVRSRQSSD